MILPVAVARGVAEGDVDRVYRRWARSRIVAGSTLRTAAGVVEVVAVEEVDPAAITDDDARAAGAQSADRVRRAFRGAPSPTVERGAQVARPDTPHTVITGPGGAAGGVRAGPGTGGLYPRDACERCAFWGPD